MKYDIPHNCSGTAGKLVVLSILTFLVVFLTFFSLVNNIQVVFTQFYYIPIILTAYWFNKKGVLYTVCLSAFYISAVYILSPHDEQILIAAAGRIVFFIGISLVSAFLALKINLQQQQITRSEERHRAIWNSIQAGIILVDAKNHTIIAANPEVQKMTGFSEKEMVGHLCHRFICPAEEGKCPIGDLGLKVDHSERVLLSSDGRKIPVLKTVAEMQADGTEYYVESFIDITPQKEAENTLLAYLREATLRVRNPVELVRDNLQELSDELREIDTSPEYFATALVIQQKNMDDILNNLKEIENAVAEKRTEIPDALREYLKR